jgi:DNA-binding response OmpR family regulator
MKYTILIVEDNAPIRENTSELLELSNYTVVTANDGKDGLDKAMAFAPDLILCDIQMPLMNGYHLLEHIRNEPSLKKTRFLFFTASSEPKDVSKGLNMGANDYIVKPFKGEELLDKIRLQLEIMGDIITDGPAHPIS